MLKYLKYSGMVASFSFNPFHWRAMPWTKNESDELMGFCYSFGWLGLLVRVWIDNGDW